MDAVSGWVSWAEGFLVWDNVLYATVGIFLLLSFIGLLLLYVFLRLTSSRDPNLSRHPSEKKFEDPISGKTFEFPSIHDKPTVYLSLVVPAYKEQDRLPVMMDETMKYLEERQEKDPKFTYEVIIVNDGSPDRTSRVAMDYVGRYVKKDKAPDKVRLLELEKNRGKGGAVRMGTLSCRGERILMVDADGATKISHLERLEKALSKVTEDHSVPGIAVGSRSHLQDEAVANRSCFRNILMHGFHLLVWLLCVRGVKDTQCGFKMFTRAAAVSLFEKLHIDRWAFDVELLYIAQQLKIPIEEVSVNWEEIEGSKLTPVWSWLQMGRDILFINLRYNFRIWRLNNFKTVNDDAKQPKPKTD